MDTNFAKKMRRLSLSSSRFSDMLARAFPRELLWQIGRLFEKASDLLSLMMTCKSFNFALAGPAPNESPRNDHEEQAWENYFAKKVVEVRRTWDWMQGDYTVTCSYVLPNPAYRLETLVYCLSIKELGAVWCGTYDVSNPKEEKKIANLIDTKGFLISASRFTHQGKKNGEQFTLNSKTGTKHYCEYQQGKKHGLETEYYKDGTLALSRSWSNDLKSGKEALYYQSGRLSYEANHKDGIKVGEESTYWNTIDHTRSSITRRNDRGEMLKEEHFSHLSEDRVTWSCEWKLGMKDGEENGYHENGLKSFVVHWTKDQEVSRICMNLKGEVIYPTAVAVAQ